MGSRVELRGGDGLEVVALGSVGCDIFDDYWYTFFAIFKYLALAVWIRYDVVVSIVFVISQKEMVVNDESSLDRDKQEITWYNWRSLVVVLKLQCTAVTNYGIDQSLLLFVVIFFSSSSFLVLPLLLF